MSINGKIHNGKATPFRNAVLESAGSLGVAEFASIAAGLGVIAVADTVAPNLVKAATDALTKTVVEPYLDYIEWGLGKVCKLEECQPDKAKSRRERAEPLARAAVLFAPSFAAHLAAKLIVRKGMNRVLGVHESEIPWWKFWKMNTNEMAITVLDEGVHMGSLLLLNTKAAGISDDLIRSSTSILEKMGMPKQKAKELADYAVIWELPNVLGFISGTAGVFGKHYGTWEKLMHYAKTGETAVSSGHSMHGKS